MQEKLENYLVLNSSIDRTKEYQKRSKNSLSAQAVAFLVVVTLIKDCYKIQISHSKKTIFSHFIGPTGMKRIGKMKCVICHCTCEHNSSEFCKFLT